MSGQMRGKEEEEVTSKVGEREEMARACAGDYGGGGLAPRGWACARAVERGLGCGLEPAVTDTLAAFERASSPSQPRKIRVYPRYSRILNAEVSEGLSDSLRARCCLSIY